MPKPAKTSDSFRMIAQNQLGIRLSAIGLVISSLVKKFEQKTDKELIALLKHLSDAARIIIDVYYNITKTRFHFSWTK